MDAGLMDSNDVLGINTRRDRGVSFRKVSTCAPVNIGPYAMRVNGTLADNQITADPYIKIFMGEAASGGTNWTYQYDSDESVLSTEYDVR